LRRRAGRPQLKRDPLGGRHTEDNNMCRYAQISGAFFTLVALAQLTRTLLQWPVQVAGVPIPVWASAVAFLIVATFAVWGFRVTRSAA